MIEIRVNDDRTIMHRTTQDDDRGFTVIEHRLDLPTAEFLARALAVAIDDVRLQTNPPDPDRSA